MKDRKKGLFADVASQAGPEDGIDPKDLAKRRQAERRQERPGQGHGVHKQEQFMSQVQMAIEAALQTSSDPVLSSLLVEEVVPQGGSLLVVVMLPDTSSVADIGEATKALEQGSPRLRREVAAAITRKETPNLSFVVLPPGAQKVED